MKKAISLIFGIEILIVILYFYSFAFFINIEIAFLSSLLVILGSMYAYKKMVLIQVQKDEYEEPRDVLDKIEDPYELYEEDSINNAPLEELDIKAIVKEEKKKIKIVDFSSMKKGSRASVSLFRLLPYAFLILGFIGLKNNGYLDLTLYLPALLIGIIIGSISGRELFMK